MGAPRGAQPQKGGAGNLKGEKLVRETADYNCGRARMRGGLSGGKISEKYIGAPHLG